MSRNKLALMAHKTRPDRRLGNIVTSQYQKPVTPAKAEVQCSARWIPASAGMTRSGVIIPRHTSRVSDMPTILVPLLLLVAGPAQKTQNPVVNSADQCTVQGVVLKAATGEPLRKATVEMWQEGVPGKRADAATDSMGHFELKNLDPGQYRLSVQRNGYVRQEYGQTKPDAPGSLLTLSPGQKVTDITIRLIPAAVITGHVYDEDGEPVQGAQVSALATFTRTGNANSPMQERREPTISGSSGSMAWRLGNMSWKPISSPGFLRSSSPNRAMCRSTILEFSMPIVPRPLSCGPETNFPPWTLHCKPPTRSPCADTSSAQ